MEIQVIVIQRPFPHCPIIYPHPLADYTPSHKTDIRQTWARYETPYAHDPEYPDNRADV
jgi:hypothetical protein